MLGSLAMCEFSVNDGEQQSEQNESDRNPCDDCNDKTENRFQNKMMNDHKIENWLTDGHKSRGKRIWPSNWTQHKMTGCHRCWNRSSDTNWYRNRIQNKLTSGHNIWSRNWQDDCVRNKLTSHSTESVVQAVGVASDRRCRQITFGIDTAASRTAVPERHPATRGYRSHWDVWDEGRRVLVSKDEAQMQKANS